MKIASKAEMYERLLAGDFGPFQKTNTLEEAWKWHHGMEEAPKGALYAIRYKVPGSAFMEYDIPPESVFVRALLKVKAGADVHLLNITRMMPDDLILVQGEVMRSAEFGYTATVSFEKKPMRIALGTSEHIRGPGTLLRLRHHFTDASYQNLVRLLDEYDAVVEFSAYDYDLAPAQNVMIWEVRSY